MFSTDRNLDEHTVDAIYQIFAEHSKHIGKGKISCRAENVPIAVAENVATRIYEVALTAMPKLTNIRDL